MCINAPHPYPRIPTSPSQAHTLRVRGMRADSGHSLPQRCRAREWVSVLLCLRPFSGAQIERIPRVVPGSVEPCSRGARISGTPQQAPVASAWRAWEAPAPTDLPSRPARPVWFAPSPPGGRRGDQGRSATASHASQRRGGLKPVPERAWREGRALTEGGGGRQSGGGGGAEGVRPGSAMPWCRREARVKV